AVVHRAAAPFGCTRRGTRQLSTRGGGGFAAVAKTAVDARARSDGAAPGRSRAGTERGAERRASGERRLCASGGPRRRGRGDHILRPCRGVDAAQALKARPPTASCSPLAVRTGYAGFEVHEVL